MTNTFDDLNLHPELMQAVTDLGFTEPTPIQAAVIPTLLEGKDVIGQAQTGTGKTAAFALPILHQIEPKGRHVQALVVAPTRELAMQVAQAMADLGRNRRIRVLTVYGGQPYGKQIGAIRKGVDVIVGTPGRLLDLIKKEILDLSHVKHVALDEADEMLSMGFVEDIEEILKATPDKKQMALFSATMPPPIRRLSQRYMYEPESITIERKELTVDTIEQKYFLVNERDKFAALTRMFEMEEIVRAIIFVRTRADAGELANALSKRGFGGEALSGDLSQEARQRVLRRFRDDQIKVLVATDVAARGLDIDDISHVFNFNLPPDPEVYVHRIGRTGRVGKTGFAYTFITPNEQGRLRRTEHYTKHRIERAEVPTIEQIQEKREGKLLFDMEVWLKRDRCRREKQIATELMEQGMDPLDIAAAALKVARSAEKQRPIEQMSKVQDFQRGGGRRDGGYNNRNGGGRGRRDDGGRRDHNGRGGADRRSFNGGSRNGGGRNSHEDGMVRLSMDAGRNQGIRPNDVVGTIAYHANIPGRAIGAIRIQDHRTYVDVPQEFVEQVLAKTGDYRVQQHHLKIEKA